MQNQYALLVICVIFIGLITVSPVHSQENNVLLPMQEKSPWGYINQNGEWVIEPQFPQAKGFNEGLAPARKKGENQWGYLDKSGEWAIEPKFGKIHAAFMNYGGKKFYSSPVDPFKNQTAPALVHDTLVMINKKGEIVKRFPDYGGMRNFHQGLAAFKQDDHWGFINEQWEVAIDAQYEEAGDFHNGLAHVKEGFGAPYGFINKKGEMVIEAQFEEAGHFNNGLAPAKADAFKPYGYIDKNGEWVIEPRFEEAKAFSNGLAFVKTEENTFYVDKNGEKALNLQFDNLKVCKGYPFKNGIARVTLVKKDEHCGNTASMGDAEIFGKRAIGYINKSGELIYQQNLAKARYLKNKQDSIKKAERAAEKRREKARKKREKEQLAQCPDLQYFGDSTLDSYVEMGYRGVRTRFYYKGDVYEKKGHENFRYHVPGFQEASGNTFFDLRPVKLKPSFMNEDKLEPQDLGYRYSLQGHDCIDFPSDATEDGKIITSQKKDGSNLLKKAHIRYTNPDDSQNFIVIHLEPARFKKPPEPTEDQGVANDGFITGEDEEKIPLKKDDRIAFKYFPNQAKLTITAQASSPTKGGGHGTSIKRRKSSIQEFNGETGKYYNDPVHRFENHYILYFKVKAYSDKKVHIKHYKKPINKRVKQVKKDKLSFSKQYLVAEYKGSYLKKAVDPLPVKFNLSE